jgi:predicted Zn-dependent protease
MTKTTRPSRLGVFLLIGLLISPAGRAAPADGNLPDLGDESAAVLSPREERRIGEDFMRQARAQLDILDDPELNEYLRHLGQRLTVGVEGQPGFHFFFVNNSSINAFAVPGGYIGVHTGLLLAAHHEAEVAAVLAHETAHITQRHIPRMIAESRRISGPALAAILAGVLIAASGGRGGEAAVALATAGLAQHELNFTRTFEQEADRIGMTILNTAGYDARAMPAFFEQMEVLGRLHENNLPEFLRTHPVTVRRIAESRNHAESFPARVNPDGNAFAHMQARLRVLGNKPEEALKIFNGKLESGNTNSPPADRYGYALALLVNKRPDDARREAALLLKSDPDYAPYHILRAELELAAGNQPAGLRAYAEAARRFPASLALTQRYASALLKNGQPAQARQLLDKAVRQQPGEPTLYKLLASAAGESGKKMEAHRAFGEYYFLTGQPRAAIEQFELAVRFAGNNFYYVASLEARIKEIRETLPPVPGKAQPGRDRPPPPGRS